MTALDYQTGRKQYARPQAILFANNPGQVIDGYHVPLGYEIGSENEGTDPNGYEFITLSDDNRTTINMKATRLETRNRTINGRMRSYHIADKLTLSTSWDNLPSRTALANPNFGATGLSSVYQYTSDGGAGGVELLDWYEKYTGSFWVYLAYDKHSNFSSDEYNKLNRYNQVLEVFFSDFGYTINKRGGTNFDFWNINLSLEEA